MSAKPQILAVDDEPQQLDALERTLRGDFEVVRARSGHEAFALMGARPELAIVLSDMRMPGGLGGLDVLTEAKRVAPMAARVAASGAIDVRGMADAINSGAVDKFVLKPWEPDYLRLQMFEALRLHRAALEKSTLEKLASTDALTKIANRWHFDERLSVELARARRHARPVALLLIDLDLFKAINDQGGHAAGDAALIAFAQSLTAHMRAIDFVARFGGDEFAVIAPDTSAGAAGAMAERMRAAVQSSLSFSLSVGVASYPESGRPEDLLLLADQALYRAKRQGRNQTVVAPERALLP